MSVPSSSDHSASTPRAVVTDETQPPARGPQRSADKPAGCLPASVEAIASRQEALLQTLIDWCNLNSGSTHQAGLLRMAETLEQAFARIPGLKAERVPSATGGAPLLRFTLRPEASYRILCSGHYDTVYGADHPFQSCRLLPDGRVRGPGVADMKGGLLVMLTALEAFEACPEAGRLGWEVLITPDEEIGSKSSEQEIIAAARRHHLALVFEPARANGDLVRSRMGTGVFRIVAKGRSAHAAQVPNKGRNAILALCEYLLAIRDLPSRFPDTLLNIGSIEGGGTVNVVPDKAEALINLRVSKKADMERLLCELQRLAEPINTREGFQLSMEGGFDRGPKECGPVEEALFERYKAGFTALNQEQPGWIHAGGGSDGNLLSAAGLPNLDGLGIVGESLHSPEETACPRSLVLRAQAAALLLLSLAREPLLASDKQKR